MSWSGKRRQSSSYQDDLALPSLVCSQIGYSPLFARILGTDVVDHEKNSPYECSGLDCGISLELDEKTSCVSCLAMPQRVRTE